jgi:hypothetical protein
MQNSQVYTKLTVYIAEVKMGKILIYQQTLSFNYSPALILLQNCSLIWQSVPLAYIYIQSIGFSIQSVAMGTHGRARYMGDGAALTLNLARSACASRIY